MKKKILNGPKRLLTIALKFYGAGLSETVIVIVFFLLISLINTSAEIINTYSERFIPEQYLFPERGLIFILVILPIVLVSLTRLGIKRYLGKRLKNVPGLNLIFRADDSSFQQGIPVAVKVPGGYSYGILRGCSEIDDNTGFTETDLWICVFIPSSPTPFTSVLVPSNFEFEQVREVELVGTEGRTQALAAIVRRECLSFGLPPDSHIRLKRLDPEEIKRMLNHSKKAKGTD